MLEKWRTLMGMTNLDTRRIKSTLHVSSSRRDLTCCVYVLVD